MLLISDSSTYLMETVAKSKKINIEANILLIPECERQITKNYKYSLILLSDSFYSLLERLDYHFELDINSEIIFENLNKLIKKLTSFGTNGI